MFFRRPEDNDDIVEIVGQDHPSMKKELGDFYIAEELLSSSNRSLLIVSEVPILCFLPLYTCVPF